MVDKKIVISLLLMCFVEDHRFTTLKKKVFKKLSLAILFNVFLMYGDLLPPIYKKNDNKCIFLFDNLKKIFSYLNN
jgi:hypothetical protein